MEYVEPEYDVKGCWGLGMTGEVAIIFAISNEHCRGRGPVNRKITIIGGDGSKVVFTNRAASQLLFIMQELQDRWNDTL